MEKTFYIKMSTDDSINSNIGNVYPGYMDDILKVILDESYNDVELRIGNFVFDVNHLRTLLK